MPPADRRLQAVRAAEGAPFESRGPVSAPVQDKSGLGPKAAATKKADLAERHPNGSADRRSRMTVAEIDEKIAEVKRGQVDKREVAEDFLAEAFLGEQVVAPEAGRARSWESRSALARLLRTSIG